MATFPSLRAAAEYAGVSHQAIKNWISDYSIGELRDGQWLISKDKLDRVIAARDQIEEIRAGLRAS